ncbi:uncharacterized protein LOC144643026 isoform X2 [Oculina patagonica]
MENSEHETAVDVIVISDDEDSQDSHPFNGYRVEENNFKNPVIVIEEDDNVNELDGQLPVRLADANKPVENCEVSSSAKRVSSPLDKFKISKHGIKELKAMVRLKKLDLKPLNKQTKTVKAMVENEKCDKLHATSLTEDSVLHVKTEKDDESKEFSGQSQTPGMGIFELVEKKYNPEQLNTKAVLANKTLNDSNNRQKNLSQESTSSKKRSKHKPPSSPSLKQSKLSIDSFSPKKRPMLHSSLRQEQALHYTAPLYCKVPLRKSELVAKGTQEESISKTFTESQVNTVQALKEENFHKSVLAALTSFMTHRRKPPPNLLFYLLNSILLTKQSSCGTECFRIMRQIQVLHPVVAMQMMGQTITWEFVSMVAKLSGCTQDSMGCGSLQQNAAMALSFLVSVMEEEAQKKKFSLVKTSAHRLLSADRRSNHIHDVIQWIGVSLKQHREEKLVQSCGHNVCPLYLLQRMLVLSLLVSERPEDSASRIANELVMVYVELQSIKHKSLLLQSVQSHLLKTKLIEVIVSNCCPSDDKLEVEGISRVGLRDIVFTDFKRYPPGHSLSDPDNSLSCDSVDITTNCEEFITLLAYLLQSFIFCGKSSLMKNLSNRMLSLDDVEVLNEIDDELLLLRARLESLCGASPLSRRSYELLDLMSSLKS